MKKTLLFGVLAAFAVSAMSVQDLNAQNPVKKQTTTEKKTEKKTDAAATPSATVEKKDCCKHNTSAACDSKDVKQCNKDNKSAAPQNGQASDCCSHKKNDTNKKHNLKSATQNEPQPNSMVKPKPTIQSQEGTNSKADDR